MDPALRLRLAAVADEVSLWLRLEHHLWAHGRTCPDCNRPDPVRLMAYRNAKAHWHCPRCQIDFRATRATVLHVLPELPLAAWAWGLVHLQHFGCRYSTAIYEGRPLIGRAGHKRLQEIAEHLLAEADPLVEVLLAPRLDPWQPSPNLGISWPGTTRVRKPTTPAPGR